MRRKKRGKREKEEIKDHDHKITNNKHINLKRKQHNMIKD